MVLCVDEKSQIQPLDRSQPLARHLAKRNGAAMIIPVTARSRCSPPLIRPREKSSRVASPDIRLAREFRAFLNTIEAPSP
jgi:hypothetical protein